jgi:8-oxo-dGTP pyrophosphatase MutT (NUDIX family)
MGDGMRDATLCFLLEGEGEGRRILLGMKKRGFGVNKWNGFGGKINEGESVEEAACRELFEEAGVIVQKEELAKRGEIYFYFPHEEKWDQIVHVYFISKWNGQPRESEEMKPQWYDIGSIPYGSMWADDEYWLPKVLDGKKIKGKFVFSEDNESMLEHEVTEVNE